MITAYYLMSINDIYHTLSNHKTSIINEKPPQSIRKGG